MTDAISDYVNGCRSGSQREIYALIRIPKGLQTKWSISKQPAFARKEKQSVLFTVFPVSFILTLAT